MMKWNLYRDVLHFAKSCILNHSFIYDIKGVHNSVQANKIELFQMEPAIDGSVLSSSV